MTGRIRLVITGSRSINDRDLVWGILDQRIDPTRYSGLVHLAAVVVNRVVRGFITWPPGTVPVFEPAGGVVIRLSDEEAAAVQVGWLLDQTLHRFVDGS